MQYLSPVTATEKYSCLPNKLGIFQISSDQQFQHSFRYGPISSHVFHGEIMYTYSMATWKWPKFAVFVPFITGQYRIPQNSAATGKCRSSAQNSMCCGKLWSLRIIAYESNANTGSILYTASASILKCQCRLADDNFKSKIRQIIIAVFSFSYSQICVISFQKSRLEVSRFKKQRFPGNLEFRNPEIVITAGDS